MAARNIVFLTGSARNPLQQRHEAVAAFEETRIRATTLWIFSRLAEMKVKEQKMLLSLMELPKRAKHFPPENYESGKFL